MKNQKWNKHPLFDTCLIATALNPDSIGPTFPPLSSFTGVTGPTGTVVVDNFLYVSTQGIAQAVATNNFWIFPTATTTDTFNLAPNKTYLINFYVSGIITTVGSGLVATLELNGTLILNSSATTSISTPSGNAPNFASGGGNDYNISITKSKYFKNY